MGTPDPSLRPLPLPQSMKRAILPRCVDKLQLPIKVKGAHLAALAES
jgi:hypothetical protein